MAEPNDPNPPPAEATTEEEARRTAYQTRHAAAQRRRDADVSRGHDERRHAEPAKHFDVSELRRKVVASMEDAKALPRRVFKGLRRRIPAQVKASPLAVPARLALRAYRRARGGDPSPAAHSRRGYQHGLPAQADAPRFRHRAHEKNRFTPQLGPRATPPPRIAAVILNYNGAHHLRALFESFLEHSRRPGVELIVVDHGSTDDSRALLTAWARRIPLRSILLPQNDSFARSTNRGIRATDAEYILLLNNDILFSGDVLDAMARYLDDPSVGMVGLQLRYPPLHEEFPGGLQHGGIKLHSDPDAEIFRPYNIATRHGVQRSGTGPELMPAVTAAFALVRREEILALGGLHEEYVYGYEDVDLCLSYLLKLQKHVVCAQELRALHDESATQNRDPGEELRQRREKNRNLLVARWGWHLRRALFRDRVETGRFWTDAPMTVAFAVTEAGPTAKAGDAFTALELARALESELGWETRLIPATGDWYDLSGIDLVIAMVDAYDPSRIHTQKPTLIRAAWLRNWFDRWPTRAGFDRYDLCLCSSETAARYLAEAHDRHAYVLRIATNPERMAAGHKREDFVADYAFTGSYWKAPREIEQHLDPAQIGGRFGLFGYGWEDHAKLSSYARGFVAYENLPDVYASVPIVIDDANHVTKPWGSINSRVFDAVAAGAMVVTNGALGAREVFGDALPVYESKEELTRLVRSFLDDVPKREAAARNLRREVLSKHTYAARARELRDVLRDFRDRHLRISIKVPAPNRRVLHEWGDWHMALALRRAFWRRGHSVRIDIIPEWHGPERLYDDVVLVMRGLTRYEADPKQVNLMWNISHPDKITDAEYESYDHVFVASASYAASLSRLKVPVTPLLQCTDPKLFFRDPSDDAPREDVLFVGNSRKQHRPVVMDALEAGLPIAIYGGLWANIVPPERVKAEHVQNDRLRQYYSNAKVVLNDHWPAMRDLGFVSNRLFDAGATGALIISDPAAGLSEVFGDTIVTYSSVGELRELVEHYVKNEDARREKGEALQKIVLGHHTFEHRAAELLEVATALAERKDQARP